MNLLHVERETATDEGGREEENVREGQRTTSGFVPSLLERMSQAEPSASISARMKGSEKVEEKQEGVAVVSRQRKSKGRKKKRRPKDTSTEVGKHGRKESSPLPNYDKEIREGEREEEDGVTVNKVPPAAETLDHSKPFTSQASPAATVTHTEERGSGGTGGGGGGGGHGVRESTPVDTGDTIDGGSVDSRQPGEQRPVETSPTPEHVVMAAEVKMEDEEVIRPRPDNSTSPAHEEMTARRGEGNATNTSYDGEEGRERDGKEEEGVTIRPREGNLTNPFLEEEASLENVEGSEEEEEGDYKDLAAVATAAQEARRHRGRRAQSDVISTAVRSSSDYYTVDRDLPEQLQWEEDRTRRSHSPQVTGEDKALSFHHLHTSDVHIAIVLIIPSN